MKILFTFLLTLSFTVFSTPNSIIAVVNNSIITLDDINTQTNEKTTKKEKMALLDRQIDIELQKEQIQILGISPKLDTVNLVLKEIAEKNQLTFEQLRAKPQFDQISATVYQNITLEGLRQVILQKAEIRISQTEITAALANNPKKSGITEEAHLANIKAQIIRSKQASFFANWIKNLRKDTYIKTFKEKLAQ
ncbi:SurA N-terminal domain-containing protein [Bathymodiolus septemdierum thioautotrophic gill symbiont]|uniref:Peptidylprolyl isomerase n=1 Tax=endosymbiont of Bathymodiolus septemdierum str. Myojin knoll TaxID=1303921 RepID=A0A0P0URP0_9GAMM|nr:hypothetical protein [Bathymodiolus septemdierum thioautotrophic gill symbiont]BAS67732.1 hypothetical protein BSEPE_0738 [endosymbiont of Bathymodiolus septemdierum str. Myojin knoll]